MKCSLERFGDVVLEVRRETVRGARWTVYTVVKGLLVELEKGLDPCNCQKNLEKMILEANPTMAPLKWVAWIISVGCNKGKTLKEIDEALRNLLDYLDRSERLIASNGKENLKGTKKIVTFSYSSTVESILRELGPDNVGVVVVSQSLPGGEGVFLASRLRGAGFQVSLVPDSTIHLYLDDESILIVGSDTVTRDGCLYNKVGTKLALLAAEDTGAIKASAFDATKISPGEHCGEVEIMEREYYVEGFGAIKYPVFDVSPIQLFDVLVTPAGILKPNTESVEKLVRDLQEYLY